MRQIRYCTRGNGFVTKQGEVVTNHHVVSGTDNEIARVYFPNGMIYEMKHIKIMNEQLDIVLRKRQTISDIQQQLVEVPIVQGERELDEQELNDTFDQANIIPYAQGSISGMIFDDEDVDVFSFRIDKQMKFFIARDYES